MANENNNINALVANDDDPTAKLEILSFAQDDFDAEAGAKTYDPEQDGNRGQPADHIVSELESDLRSRQKIIGRLQLDQELRSSHTAIALKDELIQERDRKIEDLNTEIRQRGDAEEQASERIDQLEREVSKLTFKAYGFEQELTAKSEAMSVLLAELAKKPERLDSVGEIEEVILGIDDRMSERNSSGDRVYRVLVGTVDDQVLRFPLFKNRLTIGRTRDNDIQLTAIYVSRRHAVIQTDGDATRIIDQGSKNGIQVNSAKVSEHLLCHGDALVIGEARFRYEVRKKRDSQYFPPS